MEQFWNRADDFLETLLAPVGWLFEWLFHLPWSDMIFWGLVIGVGGYVILKIIEFIMAIIVLEGYKKLVVLSVHFLIVCGLGYSSCHSDADAPMLLFLIALYLFVKYQ